MKKTYINPEISVSHVELQYHLMEPTTWNVDNGTRVPIGTDDGEEPTGAKPIWFDEE